MQSFSRVGLQIELGGQVKGADSNGAFCILLPVFGGAGGGLPDLVIRRGVNRRSATRPLSGGGGWQTRFVCRLGLVLWQFGTRLGALQKQ